MLESLFLIIGAQKCGTTTLHRALAQHPDIYMPPEKELQFFNRDERYEQGSAFYEQYFSRRETGQIFGEASPHYLGQRRAAERIIASDPVPKVIAILRDPIDRAWSHYRMTQRRGRTTLSFEEECDRLLSRPFGTPDAPDMDRDYLLLGEYGRMLGWYEELIGDGHALVLFLDDLERDPASMLLSVYRFLEVDPNAGPRSAGHSHRGGAARFPKFDRWVRESRAARRMARMLLTPQQRRSLLFWFDTELNVSAKPDPRMPAELTMRLRQHFDADTDRLEELLSGPVSWRRKASNGA